MNYNTIKSIVNGFNEYKTEKGFSDYSFYFALKSKDNNHYEIKSIISDSKNRNYSEYYLRKLYKELLNNIDKETQDILLDRNMIIINPSHKKIFQQDSNMKIDEAQRILNKNGYKLISEDLSRVEYNKKFAHIAYIFSKKMGLTEDETFNLLLDNDELSEYIANEDYSVNDIIKLLINGDI